MKASANIDNTARVYSAHCLDLSAITQVLLSLAFPVRRIEFMKRVLFISKGTRFVHKVSSVRSQTSIRSYSPEHLESAAPPQNGCAHVDNTCTLRERGS